MCFNCFVISGDANLPEWQQWSDHPVRKEYDVLMDLGEGAFSQVVLGQSKKDQSVYVALKVVYLRSPEMLEDPEHLAIMRREAEFLQLLDHPNIVECIEVVENEKQMVIIMEWLRGGHLLDNLEEMAGQHYSEQQASVLFVQLAEALACMHQYGLIHRDIKAENIVFKDTAAQAAAKGVPPIVKFIDLGMATLYNKDEPIQGALGSPGFVAPEIIMHENHAPAMDVFSLGIVLFIMLVGRKPFNIKECENLTYCNIDIKDAPGLQDARWQDLSEPAKALLLGMLEYDPAKRLTSKQVCQAEWVVTRGGLVPKLLHPDVVRGAANVASLRRLRYLVHGAIALRRLNNNTSAAKAVDLEKSVRARNEITKRLQKRHQTELGSLHSIAIQLNGRALAKKHDQGQTMEPERDLSVRGGRRYLAGSSARDFYTVHGTSKAAPFLLKPSGTAILLSEMAPNGSTPDSSWRNGSMFAKLGKSNSNTMLELASGGMEEFRMPVKPAPKKSELLQMMTSDLKDLWQGGKPSTSSDSASASSGSGNKRSFLQRISANLSQRGFRKSDKDSSVKSGAGFQREAGAASASANDMPARDALQHAYSAPVKVVRMRPFTGEESDPMQPLPHIQEGHREGMRDSIDVRSSMDPHGHPHHVITPLMKSSLGLGKESQPSSSS
ncbi:g6258 [Coccomyxa elongata]